MPLGGSFGSGGRDETRRTRFANGIHDSRRLGLAPDSMSSMHGMGTCSLKRSFPRVPRRLVVSQTSGTATPEDPPSPIPTHLEPDHLRATNLLAPTENDNEPP